ncbi:MAG TPA: hypothetical protein VGU26_06290 [Gaiellaceae bacterium]|nr:hypothetical protein [Gaiellaceae bacterium]
MRRFLVAVAVLVVVAAGPAAAATTRLDRHGTVLLDGRRMFPIVLAKGPPADGLAEVAAAGVNFVKVGPAGEWSDAEITAAIAENRAAAANGVYSWVNLSSLSAVAPGGLREELLRQVVGSLEADPSGAAIGMWKGADEPWRYRVPPSSLRFAYCLATGRGRRSWCAGRAPIDSDHLWVTVQAPRGGIPGLARYSPVTDVHGINRYPIAIGDPDPDLRDVGVWTDRLRWATPSRAVWTTLQICWTWSYDAAGNIALPTREQERFMIYHAIVNGARALAFYGGGNPKCWGPFDALRGWNWTFWDSVLEPLVREIGPGSPFAPALVRPGSTRALPTSDPMTQAISRRGHGRDLWVIAVHSGEESEDVTIRRLPRWATHAEVYTEGRSIQAAGGALTDSFGRWGVHVYRFRRAP